jgi:hypothetical protein
MDAYRAFNSERRGSWVSDLKFLLSLEWLLPISLRSMTGYRATAAALSQDAAELECDLGTLAEKNR